MGATALVASGLLAAAALWPRPALADRLDTSGIVRVSVGRALGPAVSDRGDRNRTGRTTFALPTSGGELWRKNIGGPIDSAPLVDARGDVYVVSSLPDAWKLSGSGKEVFRAKLGAAGAAVGPALLGDGTLVVVTTSGNVLGVSSTGAIRFVTPLGLRGKEVESPPLALDTGGFVVAAGKQLITFAGDGSTLARAELPERAVGTLLATAAGAVIAFGEQGVVYEWTSPLQPRRVGTFGGSVRRTTGGAPAASGAALSGPHTLLAVVDGKRVLSMDLRSGRTALRAAASAGPIAGVGVYEGPPAVGASGVVYVSTSAGLLLGLDAAGDEVFSAQIEKQLTLSLLPAAPAQPWAPAPPPPRLDPPVVVDGAGNVAFARAGGRVGVAKPDGSVAVLAEQACGAPVAVQALAPNQVVVACAEGTVVALGKK